MAQRRADTAKRLRPVLESLLAAESRFRDLSVESICAGAGLARSTFYIHFRDKGHLLEVLGADVVDELLVQATRWPSMSPTADEAELTGIIADLLHCYVRHARLIGALTEESVHDRRVRTEFQRLYEAGLRLLVEHLEHGQTVGSVRVDVDPARTVPWLLSMLDRGFYLLLRQPDVDIAAQARSVAAILWRTLYAGAPTRNTR